MSKKTIFICTLGIIIAMLLSSCGTEAPALWPWWTKEDTLAVNTELAKWRDTINGYLPIKNQSYVYDINVPLLSTDTNPRSNYVDSIIKVAHLLGFNYTVVERDPILEYTFGRKNDTIIMKDTFCYVKYRDSSNAIVAIQVDSIWTIRFYPDTTIDTTTTPAETVVTYRMLNYAKTYYNRLEEEKHFYYQTTRYLELKKDSAFCNYRFKHLTGFGSYLPNNTLAPTISYIVLTRITGQRDTFRYSPRADNKGILNLRDKDSLYLVDLNQPLEVQVTLTTSASPNYVFISYGHPTVSNKIFVPVVNNVASTTITLPQEGLNHLYIEVIPTDALFYRHIAWKTTIWALPVRVR